MLHPAGKIEELLLKFGLARVNDWHATVVPEKMPNYRGIERSFQQNLLGKIATDEDCLVMQNNLDLAYGKTMFRHKRSTKKPV